MIKIRYWPLLLFCGLFLISGAKASTSDSLHVHVHLASSVKTPSEKQPFWVVAQFSIDPGWHIYGPKADQGAPLTLNWSLPQGIRILETLWPEPKNSVYEKDVWVLVKMETDRPLLNHKITLDTQWAACSKTCTLGEAHLDLNFPIEGDLVSEADLSYWLQKKTIDNNFSWVLAVVFAFMGGIILNGMPCVLPVLSLKLFSLVRHQGLQRRQLLGHAAFFTAGVLTSFWIIAGFLALFKNQGQHLGWGFQLQSPTFIGFLSVIFFLLAMNMWGVFEVGTSFVGLEEKTLSLKNKTSALSAFLSGILACVVATPCSAPFMGTALGVAAIQAPFISFLIFTSLGLGLSFPFIMVCAFPKTLHWLPRPGSWMETLKQILGFALMATVLWLGWIFGHQQGVDGIFQLLCALLIVALGAWVYGRFGTTTRILSGLYGVSSLLAACFLIVTLTSRSPTSVPSIQWEVYSPERLQSLREQGHPVFIDFTASWCLTCQVNKKIALQSESFTKKIKELGIVAMRADWTNRDPKITEALAEYGRNSIPLYVFHHGKETEPPVILPQILTPQILVDQLESIR